MIINDLKLAYNDVSIVPAVETSVTSRSQCNPYDSHGMLPIFTAPMSCVVDEKTYLNFEKQGINVVIPRTVSFGEREKMWNNTFVAISLEEANILLKKTYKDVSKKIYICIDVANGHMERIFDIINDLKKFYGDGIVIMSGNIARPDTYIHYNNYGCDYVRVGIGGGKGCLSSSNTGIHYPYASLVSETYEIKKSINGSCKIIADGNIRGYSDVIKALALGADYVMIGSLFAQCIDSAGEFIMNDIYFTDLLKHVDIKAYKTNKINKVFYGMSTKKAQIEMGKIELKTSEGIETMLPITTDIETWSDNMKSYLQSAMSYTDKLTLFDFIGKVNLVHMSQNASNSFNK